MPTSAAATTHPRTGARPRVGVVKFASCDGCQLSILDCEDELLAVAGAVEIGRASCRERV